MHCGGLRWCRTIRTTPSPGSGFRHQQIGGPPPWGQKEDVDRDADPLLHFRVVGVRLRGGDGLLDDVRLPADTEHQPAGVGIAAKHGAAFLERVWVRPRVGVRPRRRAAANEDPVAPHDHGAIGERGIARARKGLDLDARESLRWVGRLEIALIAELHRGAERADVLFDGLPHFLRVEEPAVPGHDPPHGVHLRVL